MLGMYELADNYPAGFWACEECEVEIYDKAPGCEMELVLLDVQYQQDLSQSHCTRCGEDEEGGLLPLKLEYV